MTLSKLLVIAILFCTVSGSAWAQTLENSTALLSPTRSESATNLRADTARATEAAPTSSLALSEPVITLHGPCAEIKPPETATLPCITVVTRESFEKLLTSMNVTGKAITPETRRNLAETYAQYLALEPLAAKAGLDNTARFAEIMRWWRLRTLADMYRATLQEQDKNVSPDDIHAYYVEHLQSFQRIQVDRIVIPRTPGSTDKAKLADQKALEAAKTAHERIAKGEEPELVQKEAYTALEMASIPSTKLGTLSRSGFPTDQADELFSLEPGQVSKVETEAASYVIYKITSKQTLPEASVKEDVARKIAQNRFNDAMRSVNESAKPELNEAYFGPTAAVPSVAYPGPLSTPHP
jgi:hypothetical protein